MGLQGAKRQTDRQREGRQREGQRQTGRGENETQRKDGAGGRDGGKTRRGVKTHPSAFLELRVPQFLHEFNKLLIGDSLHAFMLTHRADETVLISSMVGSGDLWGI